ncbi:unnamed protein product [Hapterophycus canaliculatus]
MRTTSKLSCVPKHRRWNIMCSVECGIVSCKCVFVLSRVNLPLCACVLFIYLFLCYMIMRRKAKPSIIR